MWKEISQRGTSSNILPRRGASESRDDLYITDKSTYRRRRLYRPTPLKSCGEGHFMRSL